MYDTVYYYDTIIIVYYYDTVYCPLLKVTIRKCMVTTPPKIGCVGITLVSVDKIHVHYNMYIITTTGTQSRSTCLM